MDWHRPLVFLKSSPTCGQISQRSRKASIWGGSSLNVRILTRTPLPKRDFGVRWSAALIGLYYRGDGGATVALDLELIPRVIPERSSALALASLLKGFYPIFGE